MRYRLPLSLEDICNDKPRNDWERHIRKEARDSWDMDGEPDRKRYEEED